MGLDTIPDRTNGQTIVQSFFNLLKSVIKGDLVPRNTSGVATSLSGSLGTETYKWLKAYIAAGYFGCGDIKWMHTYNGTVTIPQGWMICNGDQITEAAYEAQTDKTTGDWDTYVVSSPLENLYTINMIDKYPVGVAATSQDGSGAITSVGVSGSELDLEHNHIWYYHTTTEPKSYDISGAATDIPIVTVGNGDTTIITGTSDGSTTGLTNNFSDAMKTSKTLSATQDIRPESIELIPLIRIIA